MEETRGRLGVPEVKRNASSRYTAAVDGDIKG
jgi:hypothetical protein